jgi:hypothetical protein
MGKKGQKIYANFGKGWTKKKKKKAQIETLAYLGRRVHNARIFNSLLL